MIETIFLLVGLLLLVLAIAGYLNNALYGDLGVTPTQILAAAVLILIGWLSMGAGVSSATVILLLLALLSAHRIISSLLYGDIEWGSVVLFLLAAVLLLAVSLQEILAVLDSAKSYLYSNSTNTSQVSNFSG